MMTPLAEQVADALKINIAQIDDVKEFFCFNGGSVYLVCFREGRPRFVSRKAITQPMPRYGVGTAMAGTQVNYSSHAEARADYNSYVAENMYNKDDSVVLTEFDIFGNETVIDSYIPASQQADATDNQDCLIKEEVLPNGLKEQQLRLDGQIICLLTNFHVGGDFCLRRSKRSVKIFVDGELEDTWVHGTHSCGAYYTRNSDSVRAKGIEGIIRRCKKDGLL